MDDMVILNRNFNMKHKGKLYRDIANKIRFYRINGTS